MKQEAQRVTAGMKVAREIAKTLNGKRKKNLWEPFVNEEFVPFVRRGWDFVYQSVFGYTASVSGSMASASNPVAALAKTGGITSIADVTSFTNNTLHYDVVMYNGNWECNCKDFFYRRTPCKHIEAVQTLKRVRKGAMTLKKVKLSAKGKYILEDWRHANGMPLVKE